MQNHHETRPFKNRSRLIEEGVCLCWNEIKGPRKWTKEGRDSWAGREESTEMGNQESDGRDKMTKQRKRVSSFNTNRKASSVLFSSHSTFFLLVVRENVCEWRRAATMSLSSSRSYNNDIDMKINLLHIYYWDYARNNRAEGILCIWFHFLYSLFLFSPIGYVNMVSINLIQDHCDDTLQDNKVVGKRSWE